MDSKNFAIGVLSTTATILLVGVILVHFRSNETQAGMTTTGGGYVVTVGNLTWNDEELVYVIDSSTDKMVVYRFDAGRRQIELIQGVDLTELKPVPTPTDPQQPAQPRPRTRQP